MAKKKSKKSKKIKKDRVRNLRVPELKVQNMEIEVEAREDSTLLMQKMSDEVKQELENKYGKGKISGRQEKKKAEDEIIEGCIHRTEDDKVGFPAIAFKKALINMAKSRDLDNISGKLVAGAVQIGGDILPLKYKKQKKNVDWGKSSGRTGAPRKIIRPEFTEWSCKLPISFDSSMITAEQIVNLLNLTGFHIGVGSFRKANGGNHGMFKVKATKGGK